MARDDARKLERDPKGAHWDVKRNRSGAIQSTNIATGSDTAVSATTPAAVTTVDAGSPQLLVATSASATLGSGGTVANTPATLTISRNGNQLTNSTGITTTVTLTTSTVLDTPENDPSWTINAAQSGGSVTVSWSLSREDRW